MEVFSGRKVGRQEVQELMKKGGQVVDVLLAEEFQEDHLPGAINLPLRKIETRPGGRSTRAGPCRVLQGLGLRPQPTSRVAA